MFENLGTTANFDDLSEILQALQKPESEENQKFKTQINSGPIRDGK